MPIHVVSYLRLPTAIIGTVHSIAIGSFPFPLAEPTKLEGATHLRGADGTVHAQVIGVCSLNVRMATRTLSDRSERKCH